MNPMRFFSIKINHKKTSIFIIWLAVAIFSCGLFAFSSGAQADNYAQGILESKNMLSGATVTAINGFQVTATVPAGTTVSVKFSQDKVNYYNSSGVKEGWDNCANGVANVNLSGLGWSGGILFYKLQLTTTDTALTPTVSDAQVDYDGTAVPAPSGDSYPTQGAIVSTNLLPGGALAFDNTVRFAYNISSLPSSTSASVQFSQDGASWYSSNGTLWGEDTLTTGSHLDMAGSLSLSALNWSGATSFYYKFNLYSPLDDNLTPVVSDAGLTKTTNVYYSVGQSASDLKTGTPTVTITAGVGTFSVAQTGNIGVGDRVIYNTNQIAYISARADADSAHWSLVTALGAPAGDISNSAVVSITHEFTSLSAAVTAASNASHINNTDLVAANVVLNLPCYFDSGADTTQVVVSGYSGGVNNFIKIYTPFSTTAEANNSQRHQGKWDDGKYSLQSNPSNNSPIYTTVSNVWIDGIQSYKTGATYGAIQFSSTAGNVKLSNSIARGIGNQSVVDFAGSGSIYAWNNIIYGATSGSGLRSNNPAGNFYFSNNTIYDVAIGIVNNWGTDFVKNNLVQSSVDGFNIGSGTFHASSNYNISNLASDAPGANSKNSTTVSFSDAANKDFHLSPSDTAAKNAGADLSGDANLPITTDIDGQTRSGSWDIGADEAATAIFYSVGQNTSDHKIGSPTVTIASGTATFSVAQTATNMGVGDKVTYNTSSIAYISEKISTTQWKLITVTGGTPADVTGQTVNSIAHTFSSIEAALNAYNATGADDATHLNTVNLYTGNYQLNIPCYYDTGAETTQANIAYLWVTAQANYIKVYTPTNTDTEVNLSQRHSGKWDDGKYNMKISATADYARGIFANVADFVRVEGLQISVANNDYNYATPLYFLNQKNGSEIYVSNNIIRAIQTTTNNDGIIGIYTGPVANYSKYYIVNNIVYDMNVGISNSSACIMTYGINYIYNNTIYNCGGYGGISGMSGKFYLKNNLMQNAKLASSGNYDASSTNNIVNGSQLLSSAAFGATAATGTNVGAVTTQINDASANFLSTVKVGMIVKDSAANYAYITAINSNTQVTLSSGTMANPEVYTIYSNRYLDASFADAANKDFHLASNDIAAKKTGLNLQNDSLFRFSNDIDGQERAGNWDIGADEFSEAVLQSEQSSPALDSGLVGHWTFDANDISGSTAKDVSGNSNHGVVTGATPAIGRLGQGLNYGSAGNVVTVPDNDSLEGMSELTLSAWVYPKLQSTYGRIIEKTNGNPYSFIFNNLNNLACAVGAASANSPTGGLVGKYDSWHLVNCIYDGANVSIYLDGVQIASTPKTGNVATSSTALTIGNNPAGDRTYEGKIDDVRVYNRALSESEITQLYHLGQDTVATSEASKGNTNGLVGYWSFDGPTISGTAVSDLSGSGNNGTITGATKALGKVGQGMGFDGVNDSINLPNFLSDTDPEPITVCAWFKVGSAVNGDIWSFVQQIGGSDTNNNMELRINSSMKVKALKETEEATSGNSYNLNEWNHACGVWTSNVDRKVYLNNVVSVTSTQVRGSSGLNKMSIGVRLFSSPDYWFPGQVDEVRVYNRALGTQEIGELYNVGKVQIRK